MREIGDVARAAELARASYARIERLAATIDDAALRERFLLIPVHQKTLALVDR
jgi:hypothetical protein